MFSSVISVGSNFVFIFTARYILQKQIVNGQRIFIQRVLIIFYSNPQWTCLSSLVSTLRDVEFEFSTTVSTSQPSIWLISIQKRESNPTYRETVSWYFEPFLPNLSHIFYILKCTQLPLEGQNFCFRKIWHDGQNNI